MPKHTAPSASSEGKPRRADAERSINSILDAAPEALASDPDVSMTEIARRAGVVRATIYVHFPTRESLVAAVTERALVAINSKLPQEELHRLHVPVLEHLQPLIERGQRDGAFPPRPPGLVALRDVARDGARRGGGALTTWRKHTVKIGVPTGLP